LRANKLKEEKRMNPEQKPTVEQVFGMMRKTMGSIPTAIEKAVAVDEGALDEETRTLIYLASALAASSKACIQAMANKAKMQGIAPEKVLETVRIVRFALATKIVGDAEPVFEAMTEKK
jgi:alkylhydroperoxidase/carboxymuconolactone decarboxylase family protein YurZ